MIGQSISHYRILSRIGAGGMGEVYLAQDTALGRQVALKLLPADFADDPDRRGRFLVEAKAASSLNHPNVCTIHEVGETDDGRPFIAMEYLKGEILDKRLATGPVGISHILDIGIGIADALDAAHAEGIVHRDIKPSNISLDDRGQVKVLDFGLAKRLAQQTSTDQNVSTQLRTEEGKVLGTPFYMSPEQACAQQVDHRTDLFSLGVVLYQLVTGRLPFAGETPTETIHRITTAQPDPMARFNYDVPPALERIILKCLQKDPDNRYQSSKELLVDQRHAKRESDTAQWPADPTADFPRKRSRVRDRRKRRWPIAATIATVLFSAALSAGWFYVRHGQTPAHREVSAGAAQSIAVLPFENLSPNEQDKNFSDGLTEDIINALVKVNGLRVPARTSSIRFEGAQEDIRAIGEQLNVRTVLEGSIRRAGDRLRVTVQLIDVADGFIRWSETYDREMNDILAVQADVATRVATALKAQLIQDDPGALTGPPTRNVNAHDPCLKGTVHAEKWTRGNLR